MILVLEDDPSTRDVLNEFLYSLGYESKAVADCDEAIDELKRYCPAILIADVVLANGDAKPAIKFCQEHHKDCKVIIVTAMHAKDAHAFAKDLNIEDILLKPFKIEDFVELLRRSST